MESVFKDKAGKKWRRVTKNRARKMFNKGRDIYFLPCKINPVIGWDRGMVIPPKENNNPKEKIFDQVCDVFERYGCNSRLGKKASFYI